MRPFPELSPEELNAIHSDFYWIVSSGMTCGLEHPIQWAIQAWRTPGGTLSPTYYERMTEVIPLFLIDMYRCHHMRLPETAEEVHDWGDAFFTEEHPARGFFRGWSNFDASLQRYRGPSYSEKDADKCPTCFDPRLGVSTGYASPMAGTPCPDCG